MNIIKSLKIEFLVIVGILFFGAILGYQECLNFWKMDIGMCLAAIGAIWMVASFFRIYDSLGSNLASLITGGTVFLLGFGVYEYGFFTGMIIVGLAGIYISSMGHLLYPNISKAIFVISVILIPLGMMLRPFDVPTNPKKHYQPITCNTIKWEAFVYCYTPQGNEIGTNLANIVGNEESAYKQSREIVKNWKNKNTSYRIREVQVRIQDDLYTEAYDNGYVPTHSLFKRYPEKFLPKWCNLRDLEN